MGHTSQKLMWGDTQACWPHHILTRQGENSNLYCPGEGVTNNSESNRCRRGKIGGTLHYGPRLLEDGDLNTSTRWVATLTHMPRRTIQRALALAVLGGTWVVGRTLPAPPA